MLDNLNVIGYYKTIAQKGDGTMNDEITLTHDQAKAFTIEAQRRKLELEATRTRAQRKLNSLLFPTESTMSMD
jgi:hypothetical protein